MSMHISISISLSLWLQKRGHKQLFTFAMAVSKNATKPITPLADTEIRILSSHWIKSCVPTNMIGQNRTTLFSAVG